MNTTTLYNKSTAYAYDLSNQMTQASVSTPIMDETTGEVTMKTDTNVNVYNEAGQRMSKTEEGEEERYFYTGSTILYTKNQHGDLLTENIVDLSGQIIASKRFDDDGDPGTTYELANLYFFYHYDIRGSVTAIVRPDGTLIEGYTYDEFGNLASTEYDSNGDPVEAVDEIFGNEVTYTGSIYDTSTGLQYMNARYYNATTGRFLSQDTYSGNVYDPWTQHLYSYCGNNPVNFIDPTGHQATVVELYAQANAAYEQYLSYNSKATDYYSSMIANYRAGKANNGKYYNDQYVVAQGAADYYLTKSNTLKKQAAAAVISDPIYQETLANYTTTPEDIVDDNSRQVGSNTASEIALSILVPYAAGQVNANADLATQFTMTYYGTTADGTIANAFRHAMWQALNCQSIGADITYMFACAHENRPGNDTGEEWTVIDGITYTLHDATQMDIDNNAVGIAIGTVVGTDLSDSDLANLVYNVIVTEDAGSVLFQ